MRIFKYSVAMGIAAAASMLAFQPAMATTSVVRIADQLCNARSLAPRDLGECLRKAQEESDRGLADRVQAIHRVIDARTDAAPPQKLRWKKAVDESQTMWTRFRNNECQELVPFETPNKNRLAEEQRACILEHNARRGEELIRRYPAIQGTADLR